MKDYPDYPKLFIYQEKKQEQQRKSQLECQRNSHSLNMEEMKKMSEKIEKNEKILRAILVDKNELDDLKKNVEDVNMQISELYEDFRTSKATLNMLRRNRQKNDARREFEGIEFFLGILLPFFLCMFFGSVLWVVLNAQCTANRNKAKEIINQIGDLESALGRKLDGVEGELRAEARTMAQKQRMKHLQIMMRVAPEQLINQTVTQGKFSIKGNQVILNKVTGEYEQLLMGIIISREVPSTFNLNFTKKYTLMEHISMPSVLVGVRNQLSSQHPPVSYNISSGQVQYRKGKKSKLKAVNVKDYRQMSVSMLVDLKSKSVTFTIKEGEQVHEVHVVSDKLGEMDAEFVPFLEMQKSTHHVTLSIQ